MDFEEIEVLRQGSSAWKLLRADNAPLVLAFLGQVFVEENARSVAAGALIALLDDELYAVNERLGRTAFPKTAKAYLDDWASPQVGWLRKYYPVGEDEAFYDATPAVEKALLIVTPLQKIHVIEPYVAAVGFVDNPTGAYSRLQSLTIEEYREQKAAHGTS